MVKSIELQSTKDHNHYRQLKVIPKKLKLPTMNFFETFPECSLPSTVLKNTTKMVGYHARLRAVMGQSYPIYTCTCANHVCYSLVQVIFCGSWKNLGRKIGRKCRAYGTICDRARENVP